MTTTAEPGTETAAETAAEPVRGDAPKRKFVPPNLAFGWDKGSLVVRSQDVMDGYNTAYLSPSTSKAMDGCPARWAAEKAMPSTEDPFGAAELGTSAHSVMEDLMQMKGSERSEDAAMEILLRHSKIAWPNREDQALRGKWIAEVYNAYKGLFEIEDVTQAVVKQTEMRADGVEIVGVPFKGFIDRVDYSPDGLKVIDYKSGKVPQNIGRFGDDHGDQIRLYAEVIRVIEGHMPAEGLLYYTRHAKARVVPINKQKMREVLNKFKKSWVDLNHFVDTATFPTKTSALCGWCPLVNSCPSAQADGKVDRKGGAPSKIDLGIPVLRTFDAEDLTRDARRAAARRTPAPAWDLDFGAASDEPLPLDPEASAPATDLVDPEADTPAPEVGSDVEPSDVPAVEKPLPADPAGEVDVPFETPAVLVEAVPGEVATEAVNPSEETPETGSAPAASAHLDHSTETTQTTPIDREKHMSNLLAEGKPWEETINGSLNPASYAATAVFGTASLAYEEIVKAGVKPSRVIVDALATTFAHMVNEAQMNLTGVQSFQDSANTRLRGAMRTYLDLNPLPWGKNKAAWDLWVATGSKHITAIASAAVRLYEADLSGEPWAALAVEDEPEVKAPVDDFADA